MPRTREQLRQAAADAERWLDSLDPGVLADSNANDLRRLGAAVRGHADAEVEIAEAVAAARAAGRSWGEVALILGVTRQAARERFGEPANRP